MNQMKKEELETTISDSDRIECAIRHIQTAIDVDPWAVEIAVEAMKTQLSAEGTTSDLISRQKAIDALMDFDKKLRKINWYQYPHTEYECRGVDEAIVKIENVPSVQPERKNGRWLIREGISDAQCSECKMYFRDVYDMDNSDAFCRQCGTKMEGLKVVEDE